MWKDGKGGGWLDGRLNNRSSTRLALGEECHSDTQAHGTRPDKARTTAASLQANGRRGREGHQHEHGSRSRGQLKEDGSPLQPDPAVGDVGTDGAGACVVDGLGDRAVLPAVSVHPTAHRTAGGQPGLACSLQP
ncbi:hypothetical protein LIA77_03940 [Sarocladium implicatum]|nr:hypothetical protein LIA77_03940 [Sarocladium implicatum]